MFIMVACMQRIPHHTHTSSDQSNLFFPVLYGFDEKSLVILCLFGYALSVFLHDFSLDHWFLAIWICVLGQVGGCFVVDLFCLLGIFGFTSYYLYFSFSWVVPLELRCIYCRILRFIFCILIYLHFSDFSVVSIPLLSLYKKFFPDTRSLLSSFPVVSNLQSLGVCFHQFSLDPCSCLLRILASL